jgi:hypothetical protein
LTRKAKYNACPDFSGAFDCVPPKASAVAQVFENKQFNFRK